MGSFEALKRHMKIRLALALVVACFLGAAGWLVNSQGSRHLSVADREVGLVEDGSISLTLKIGGEFSEEAEIEIKEYPQNGRITCEDSKYIYRPKPDFYGKDRFRYYAQSEGLRSNIGTVKISILSVNDPPVAVNQQITGSEDMKIHLILEAIDKDRDNLKYSLVSYPSHGKIKGSPPILEYIPHELFFGEDGFSFVAEDDLSRSDPAWISLSINEINDKPIAHNQNIQTFRNIPIEVSLFSVDPDGDVLSFVLEKKPEHGRIKRFASQFVYRPDWDFTGRDRLSYRAFDKIESSNFAWVDIHVESIDSSSDFQKALGSYVKKGGVAIGNHLNPDHIFQTGNYIPASILKIATAAASLEILGEEFRFKTELFFDRGGNLYIKGYGDPSLSTLDWDFIGEQLAKKGVFERPIRNLILDDSAFVKGIDFDGRRKSINYFDAPLGALASNFNTVVGRVDSQRRIVSCEDNTPVTSLIIRRARGLPKGLHHFSIAKNSEGSTWYSGELARAIFEEYGAEFEGDVLLTKVPMQLKPILTYHSRPTLKEVVRKMLKDSNNFIANQLLLAMALKKFEEPVSIDHGVQILTYFLKNEVDINSADFIIVEGSGLSKRNRINLLAMLKIVNYFNKYKELLPSLRVSKYFDLARSGRKWKVMAKSGTLKKVSTLAGFIQIENNQWKPFVIMLGQNWRNRGTVMEIIGQYYNG